MLLRQAYGKVLRDTRRERSETLREVSKRSFVSLGYLCEIERGDKEPSSQVLEDICDALDITVPELLVCAARNMEMEEGVGA